MLYKKLYNLYFSLNPILLASLENHCIEESENKYNLLSLIEAYAAAAKKPRRTLQYITELYNNNSISCMEEYYDFIDYMLSEV